MGEHSNNDALNTIMVDIQITVDITIAVGSIMITIAVDIKIKVDITIAVDSIM